MNRAYVNSTVIWRLANYSEVVLLRSAVIPAQSHPITVPLPQIARSVQFRYFSIGQSPISEATIHLNDYSRHISITGSDAVQVEALGEIIRKGLEKHATWFGGSGIRSLIHLTFSVVVAASLVFLIISPWWSRHLSKLSLNSLILSAFGMVILVTATLYVFIGVPPWDRFFPGTATREYKHCAD